MGRCSHVASLFLGLNEHVKAHGYEAISSTSKPCKWNTGSKRKDPKRVECEDYTPGRKKVTGAYDPRPTKFQKNALSEEENNNFIASLQLECGAGETMWESLLDFKYSDDVLEQSEELVLIEQCNQFLNNNSTKEQQFSTEVYMIPDTEKQSESDIWHKERMYKITASKCKVAAGLTSISAKINFFRQHLWGLDKVTTAGMAYGVESESQAFSSYAALMQSKSSQFSVITTGLWANKNYPGLACSPDGLVFDPYAKGYGCLEIKCPHTLKDEDPNLFHEKLTKKQLQVFCLWKKDGENQFRKTHTYYYQVQMCMGITGLKWCDFVLWSCKGILVHRIEFEQELWVKLSEKLHSLYKNVLVPEFFQMRTPRNLPVLELKCF